jgi:hypothetical protein
VEILTYINELFVIKREFLKSFFFSLKYVKLKIWIFSELLLFHSEQLFTDSTGRKIPVWPLVAGHTTGGSFP